MTAEEFLKSKKIKTNIYVNMSEGDTISLPYLMDRFKATNDRTAIDKDWLDTLENLLYFETVPDGMKNQIEEIVKYLKSRADL